MNVTLTDHEQRFADSAHGKMLIAKEAARHQTSEAYKGASARPWTDAMAADAARRLATSEARGAVASAAVMADSDRQMPALRAQRDAAYEAAKERTRNAWRNDR